MYDELIDALLDLGIAFVIIIAFASVAVAVVVGVLGIIDEI